MMLMVIIMVIVMVMTMMMTMVKLIVITMMMKMLKLIVIQTGGDTDRKQEVLLDPTPQEYMSRRVGPATFRGFFADWAAHNSARMDYITRDQVEGLSSLINLI